MGHSSDAREMMKNYKIGELAEVVLFFIRSLILQYFLSFLGLKKHIESVLIIVFVCYRVTENKKYQKKQRNGIQLITIILGNLNQVF